MPTDAHHSPTPSPPSRAWSLGLAGALLVAIALQAVVVARSPIIACDGIRFVGLAARLAADPLETMRAEDQHPGYPALILAARPLVRPWLAADEHRVSVTAARLVSNLAGLALVYAIWLLARQLFNQRVADITALLTAILPLFRQNATDALSDSPHALCYVIAAWLAVTGIARRETKWFAAAGVASGAAYWIRPEGLSISLMTAAALSWALLVACCHAWLQRTLPADRLTARQALRGLLAIGLTTTLVIAPYMVLAGKITSKKNPIAAIPTATPVANSTATPAAIPVTPAANVVVPSPTPAAKTVGLVAELTAADTLPDEAPRPDSFGGVLFEMTWQFCQEAIQALRYLLLVPLFVGRFAPARIRPTPRPYQLMELFAASHLLLLAVLYYTAGYMSHRHFMPMIALCMPCIGAGTIHVFESLAARLHWHAFSMRPVLYGLAVVIAIIVPRAWRPLNTDFAPLVEAAVWVKGQAQPGDAVLASSRYVPFYSEIDGPLLGLDLPNLETGLAAPPASREWPFIVLEVEPAAFWSKSGPALLANYSQAFKSPSTTRHGREVLVFRPRKSRELASGRTAPAR